MVFLFVPFLLKSQINWKERKLTEFENIFTEKISEDSLQSTFFIAIKNHVLHHYHKEHSECIVILSGKGEMTLGKQVIKLQKGMQVSVPKNTIHSVKVIGRKPLKVKSVQSPRFDGSDRHFLENNDH